jgi:hypothetical protein
MENDKPSEATRVLRSRVTMLLENFMIIFGSLQWIVVGDLAVSVTKSGGAVLESGGALVYDAVGQEMQQFSWLHQIRSDRK